MTFLNDKKSRVDFGDQSDDNYKCETYRAFFSRTMIKVSVRVGMKVVLMKFLKVIFIKN